MTKKSTKIDADVFQIQNHPFAHFCQAYTFTRAVDLLGESSYFKTTAE